MAYSLSAFQKIQISNPEGTPGTAEAATEVIIGTITQIMHDKEFYMPQHDRGSLALNYEQPFQVASLAELTIEADFYDRLAVFLFANSIRGNVTPTQPDNIDEPNHYRWVYEPSLSGTANTPDATNGIDTYTLEYGDNNLAKETEHLFTVSWELSGSPREGIMLTWNVMGRRVTETTFTAALNVPAMAHFPMNKAKFYIDTSYAGIGGTQKSGMLRSFTYTFETQFTARFAADGNYYFSSISESKKAPKLEMTWYYDGTNADAEFEKFKSQALTFIRIELNSEVEMDSGQANPPYVWLDGAFRYTEFPNLEDEDGTLTVTVVADGWLDPTSSKMMTASVGTTMDAFS